MAGNKVSRQGSSHNVKSEKRNGGRLALLGSSDSGLAKGSQGFLSTEPPLEAFSDVSESFLQGFELRRLNDYSNLQKELRDLLSKGVESLAQGLLARWLRKRGTEILSRSTSHRPPQLRNVNKTKLERLSIEAAKVSLADPRTAGMEPWFQTREVAKKILRLQSVPERRKWAVYYSRWGCVRCGRRGHPHSSNGMCTRCHPMLAMRLREVVKTLMKRA